MQDTNDINEGNCSSSCVVFALKYDCIVTMTLTGSDGFFVFDDVAPGTYIEEEENPEEMTLTV